MSSIRLKIILVFLIANLSYAINCMDDKSRQNQEDKIIAKNTGVSFEELKTLYDLLMALSLIQDFIKKLLSDGAISPSILQEIIAQNNVLPIAGLQSLVSQYVGSQAWKFKEHQIPHKIIERSSLNPIILSPNGQYLFDIQDQITKILDLNSNKIIIELADAINGLSFSHDSKSFAVSFNGSIKIYDIKNEPYAIRSINNGGIIATSLQFSNDGKYLAIASYEKLKLYDLKINSFTSLYSSLSGRLWWAITFSPDSKTMISGDFIHDCSNHGCIMKVWDLESKDFKYKYTIDIYNGGHAESIEKIKYSSNGKYFASSSRDKSIKLWDSETFKCLYTFNKSNESRSFDFSPDNHYIAAGFLDGSIEIFSLTNKNHSFALDGHSSSIKSVIYTPDGKFLITCSIDEIKRWEIK